MTHDVNKLKEKLKLEYSYLNFEDYSGNAFYILIDTFEHYTKLKSDDKLKSLIEFYGYYISNTYIGLDNFRIFVEFLYFFVLFDIILIIPLLIFVFEYS